MSPEAEQPEQAAGEPARVEQGQGQRRFGAPVWRTGKPDAFLAAAVDTARTAIEGIVEPSHIGAHLAAKSEGDRLVTHLFESLLPGYQGWQWYAVLTRNSRSKVVTVSELGLLPSEDSILSPEWVPWAERVRPEDSSPEDSRPEDSSPEDSREAEGAGLPAAEADAAAAGADWPEDDSEDSDGPAEETPHHEHAGEAD